MTAPDLTTWTVAEDAEGEATLWYDDEAVIRHFDLHRACGCDDDDADLLWQVLTAVLAPDYDTVAQISRRVDALLADDEGVVVTLVDREIRAVLAALAGTSAQARHTDDDGAGGAS